MNAQLEAIGRAATTALGPHATPRVLSAVAKLLLSLVELSEALGLQEELATASIVAPHASTDDVPNAPAVAVTGPPAAHPAYTPHAIAQPSANLATTSEVAAIPVFSFPPGR